MVYTREQLEALVRRLEGHFVGTILDGSGDRVETTLRMWKEIARLRDELRFAVARGELRDDLDQMITARKLSFDERCCLAEVLLELEHAVAAQRTPRSVTQVLRRVRGFRISRYHQLLADLLPRMSEGPTAFEEAWNRAGAAPEGSVEASLWNLYQDAQLDVDFSSVPAGALDACEQMETIRMDAFRAALLNEDEDGPLATLRAEGKVEAAAVALDRLGVAPRTTVFNLLREFDEIPIP